MKKFFNPFTAIILILLIAGCVKPRLDNINYYLNSLPKGTDSIKDVVINEFCARAPVNYLDSDDANISSHWIELFNGSDSTVNFSNGNYYLTDDSTNPGMYQLTAFSIAPRGYMIVFADDSNKITQRWMHANFKISKSGGQVGLYKKISGGFVPLSLHDYDSVAVSGSSEGLLPDDGSGWYDFVTPTPLASNTNSANNATPVHH
jgi:lamin tail-like protein